MVLFKSAIELSGALYYLFEIKAHKINIASCIY